MKKSGLRNRFDPTVRQTWELDWWDCMVCHKNQWNALHHIISPSSMEYVDGEHNTSILNSCPIHNFGCHIDNEAWLNKNVSALLISVASALQCIGYELKPIDKQFLKVYKKLYGTSR